VGQSSGSTSHGGVAMSDRLVQSQWFGTVSMDANESSTASFSKVERLLSMLQPSAMDGDRSTADFTTAGVQLLIEHVSDPAGKIDLHYTSSDGGMFHPLGFEEYYQLRGEPSVEQDALDDLAVVLASSYAIEGTRWRGRVIRRTVRADRPGGEHGGTSVSGWLIPPRWLLPRRQLVSRSRTVSYS
jgi:hypothetical protein